MNTVIFSFACFLSSLAPPQGGPCTPAWVPEFGADPDGIGGLAQTMASFDDGTGAALYVGGFSFHPDGQSIAGVMKRTGTGWSPLGSGVGGGSVRVLAASEHPDGAALYVGGDFDTAGGLPANFVARWDGAQWATLAGGMNGSVYALTTFDDGTGPALYAGGFFTSAGGIAASKVAKWDGVSWSPLGLGVSPGRVNALIVFDDGNGPALYAGGGFTSAGGAPANRVARWDGSSWSPLGAGVNAGTVSALAVFDDGSGPALYAGGDFVVPGGRNVARWNGASWSPVGGPFDFNDRVYALCAFDDGSGPGLFAAGAFSTVAAPRRIARWDGVSWSPLGGGMSNTPYALLGFDDGAGAGASLFVGGLSSASDSGDSFLARWQGCRDALPPTISHPGSVFVRDALGGPLGEVVTFSVSASDERDPAPVVSCMPPSGSFFPPGPTSVTCTATDAAGNSSSAVFEVFVYRKTRPR